MQCCWFTHLFCCLQVDFHSVFWHAKELGIDIVRCPVST